jgi:alanine dehydrogenase
MSDLFTIGFPRMHKEPGEKRDFLPAFISRLHKRGGTILLEYGYGSEIGYHPKDYFHAAPSVQFVSRSEIYQQDYVLVLRCPTDDELRLLHPGACLISMLHYPTRPKRVAFLRSLGVEAISLDSLKDDTGRRLVENLRSVGWNGIEAAFKVLQQVYPSPGLFSSTRNPIHLSLLGAGAVGVHVVQAAVNYGNPEIRKTMNEIGAPGVQVTVVDYDLTQIEKEMRPILARTDILVDATQRPDASVTVIPNEWISYMPNHAILLDLSVDPYDCSVEKGSVKGIEGIPQGNLDQYTFAPDDIAYETIPECVATKHRRYAVSCYSWPGIYPKECMEVYGKQIQPILRTLIDRGGIRNINSEGTFFERAISRAMLSRWEVDLSSEASPKRSKKHNPY